MKVTDTAMLLDMANTARDRKMTPAEAEQKFNIKIKRQKNERRKN